MVPPVSTALMCPKGRNAYVVGLGSRPPSFVVGSLDLYCVYSMRSPGTNGEVAVYGQMNSRKPGKLYNEEAEEVAGRSPDSCRFLTFRKECTHKRKD